jgi:DNA-binding helix-hairpin-helix protein with protein kinase domain
MEPLPTAALADGRTIRFRAEVLGSGAMKEVHLGADGSSVLCFYTSRTATNDPRRRQRLEAILGRHNLTLAREQGGAARDAADAAANRRRFCWPTAVVTAPRLGVLAPVYPPEFCFATGPAYLRGKPKHGLRFIGPKNRRLLAEVAPAERGDWRGHLGMCLAVAEAVARLHEEGLVHSDLSPANVLVDPTRGACLVTDIDALVVDGLYPPDVLGTHGYIAPEVLATMRLPRDDPARVVPDVRTDRHALAVLVYQYLLLRHPLEGPKVHPGTTAEEQELAEYGRQALFCEHPADDSNRPAGAYVPSSALGPLLHDLFVRAFVDGLHQPERRPPAAEWADALQKTHGLLRACPNAERWHRWYVAAGPDVACPFCRLTE